VRNRARSRLSIVAAIALSLALLASACSSDEGGSDEGDNSGTTAPAALDEKVDVDAPGVTDTEIRYSVLATETNNPAGTCVLSCYANGIRAYFDYVNTEFGGIYGRKLVADDLVDDEFLKNQEAALEIIAADNTFGTFGNSPVPTGWQSLADEGIPLYVWATNPTAMAGNESIFGEVTPRCYTAECPDRAVPYLMKISGKHKLASVGYGIADSSKMCAKYQEQGVEKYKDQIGSDAEVAYFNDDMQYGFPNGVAPEITAMKNAGANILSACIDNAGMKTLIQEAQRQDLDILPLLPQGYDNDFIAQQGGVYDGGYLRNSIRSFQADLNEAQQKFREYMQKLDYQESEVSIYGWINAALAYEGLKQAGPDFSRQKVVDATNTLTDFTAGGLTAPQNWVIGHEAPTIDDAETVGQKYECYNIMTIENDAFQLVGDPSKPFTCWPGTSWEWEQGEPEALSFE